MKNLRGVETMAGFVTPYYMPKVSWEPSSFVIVVSF